MLDPENYPAPAGFDLTKALECISAALPELSLENPRVLGNGFDNVALLAGGMIFRFPRDKEGEARLRHEERCLNLIRPRITMTVPDLSIHEGPLVFSSHRAIPGEVFFPDKYLRLDEVKRDRMAEGLALLYAQLHAIPLVDGKAVGAKRVDDFQSVEKILSRLEPVLDSGEWQWAQRVISLWSDLPADPLGDVFGWFDGHGWNMAIDFEIGQINGVFDFADAGFGSIHNDLMHTNLIHPDLTARVTRRYAAMTGKNIGPRRIAITTSMHRLSNLAGSFDDPDFGALVYGLFQEWRKHPESRI